MAPLPQRDWCFEATGVTSNIWTWDDYHVKKQLAKPRWKLHVLTPVCMHVFLEIIIYNICMHMIRSERKKLEWNEGITGHTVAQRALYSCMIYCSNLLLSARVYPPAFGQRLLRIWESSDLGDVPLRSLRNISVYIYLTHAWLIFLKLFAGGGQRPFKDKVTVRFSRKWNWETRGLTLICTVFFCTSGQVQVLVFQTPGRSVWTNLLLNFVMLW